MPSVDQVPVRTLLPTDAPWVRTMLTTAWGSVLVARKGDTAAALQDIWWAVLNSNEFIFNH